MDKLPPKRQSQAPGLNLVDITSLPDEQRQLINWMMRRGNCSLLEVAAHIYEDEETAFKIISPLLEKGFVQEQSEEKGVFYRVKLAPKRGRQLPSKLKQALEKQKNLDV